MPGRCKSKPLRVANVSFVQVRIEQPHDIQMRIELDDRVTLVIARPDQIPLSSRLIIALRDGMEAAR